MDFYKALAKILLPEILVAHLRKVRDSAILRACFHDLKSHRACGKEIVHFLHLGKTGGTALKGALGSISDTPSYKIVLHRHRFSLMNVPAGDKFFFFVRDPIARFVSGFYSRQRRGRPKYDAPWSRDEEAAFRQFHTPNQLATALSSENQSIRRAAVRAMKSITHVKTSYWYWFKDETYFLSRMPDLLFLGFQETLDEDFEVLKMILGLPDAAVLPEDEINAHRNPLQLDTYLGDVALRTLREWYASDYEFVKLCKQIVRPGAPVRSRSYCRRFRQW